MAHVYAYCFADGVIHLGTTVPAGALPIVDGIESDIQRAIHGSARLAYDGETWLVPGIPEAISQSHAVEALIAYRERIHLNLEQVEGDDADG